LEGGTMTRGHSEPRRHNHRRAAGGRRDQRHTVAADGGSPHRPVLPARVRQCDRCDRRPGRWRRLLRHQRRIRFTLPIPQGREQGGRKGGHRPRSSAMAGLRWRPSRREGAADARRLIEGGILPTWCRSVNTLPEYIDTFLRSRSIRGMLVATIPALW